MTKLNFKPTVYVQIKKQPKSSGSLLIVWSSPHINTRVVLERAYAQVGDKYISSFFASLKRRGFEPVMYEKPGSQSDRHWEGGRKVPGHLFITKQENYERRLERKRR